MDTHLNLKMEKEIVTKNFKEAGSKIRGGRDTDHLEPLDKYEIPDNDENLFN